MRSRVSARLLHFGDFDRGGGVAAQRVKSRIEMRGGDERLYPVQLGTAVFQRLHQG